MNDEFQWWLLLVGLVIGALLVFLVMVDFSRSSDEQSEAELDREADWIAGMLRAADGPVDPGLIQEVLRLNREWLAGIITPPATTPAAKLESTLDAGAGVEPVVGDTPDV